MTGWIALGTELLHERQRDPIRIGTVPFNRQQLEAVIDREQRLREGGHRLLVRLRRIRAAFEQHGAARGMARAYALECEKQRADGVHAQLRRLLGLAAREH